MAPFRENIRRLAAKFESCEEWLDLVRDLSAPINLMQADEHFSDTPTHHGR
jgi:hypothetical protein